MDTLLSFTNASTAMRVEGGAAIGAPPWFDGLGRTEGKHLRSWGFSPLRTSRNNGVHGAGVCGGRGMVALLVECRITAFGGGRERPLSVCTDDAHCPFLKV
jgi:hypothetical protein